jgi:hypothetical protein
MDMKSPRLLRSCVVIQLCNIGCDYSRDTVGPGYYGEMTQARAADAMSGAAGAPPAMKPTPRDAGSAAPAIAKPAATSCDMTGRWLLTLHKTTDALGNFNTYTTTSTTRSNSEPKRSP